MSPVVTSKHLFDTGNGNIKAASMERKADSISLRQVTAIAVLIYFIQRMHCNDQIFRRYVVDQCMFHKIRFVSFHFISFLDFPIIFGCDFVLLACLLLYFFLV